MKCLEWVGNFPEWVGFRPPSLHVKSCSGRSDKTAMVVSLLMWLSLPPALHD